MNLIKFPLLLEMCIRDSLRIVHHKVKEAVTGKWLGAETIQIAVPTDHGDGKASLHIIDCGGRCRIIDQNEGYVGGDTSPFHGEGGEGDGALGGQTLVITVKFLQLLAEGAIAGRRSCLLYTSSDTLCGDQT